MNTTKKKTCGFETCERDVAAKGLCNGHWRQQHKGKPLTPLGELRSRTHWNNGYKVCPGCQQNKHSDEYYKNTKTPSGFTSRCKPCVDEANTQWRSENVEKVAEIQRSWREANEGHTYRDAKSGYVKYIGYKHPAATASGITHYHRILLWDHLNGQDAFCYWGCGTLLRWDKSYPQDKDGMCVDHLNGITHDNRIENIVPCCGKCNTTVSRASRKVTVPCAFGPCERDAVSNGLCVSHNTQQWLGKPLTPIRDRVTKEERAEIVSRIKAGETLEAVSATVGLDKSYIARVVSKETGKSVTEIRRESQRVFVDEIKAGSKVKDVAKKYGVTTITVNRAFTYFEGINPQQWKRQERDAA